MSIYSYQVLHFRQPLPLIYNFPGFTVSHFLKYFPLLTVLSFVFAYKIEVYIQYELVRDFHANDSCRG